MAEMEKGGVRGPRREARSARTGPSPFERLARAARSFALVHGWRRSLAALLAGATVGLAHAPFDFAFVLFIAFPALVLLLDGIASTEIGLRGRVLSPLWVGWCFGLGVHGAGLWWIGNALVTSGSGPAWLAPIASFALSALLALFPAVAVLIARQLWTAGAARALVLAAAWGLMELLRAVVATGFPWNAIGYAAMPETLLMQSVAVLGLDAVNVLTVWAAASVVLLFEARTRALGVLLPVLLVAGHAGYGAWRLSSATVSETGTVVRVVQPAVAQDEKWDEQARIAIFRDLIDLTAPPEGTGAAPDLVVWPETAFPFVLSETPEALAVLGDVLTDGQVLLAGGVRTEGLGADRLWFNSLFAIDADGRIEATRDKVHLVPFGEYMPTPVAALAARLGVSKLVEAPGDFTAANRRMTLALPGDAVFLPLICYEAIFPRGLIAGGEPATAILNVTNDAWFGATPGPHQHMRQSRVRAVETGLPMVRAANDGISAIIDPLGRVVAGLEHGARGAFDANLPEPLAVPFPSIRALPWFWLLIGFAFAMLLFDTWRERRAGG